MDRSNTNDSAANGSNSIPTFNIRDDYEFHLQRIQNNLDRWQMEARLQRQRDWQQQGINLSQMIYQRRLQQENGVNTQSRSVMVDAITSQRQLLNTHQHYAPIMPQLIDNSSTTTTNVNNQFGNLNHLSGSTQQQSTPMSTADMLSQSLLQLQHSLAQSLPTAPAVQSLNPLSMTTGNAGSMSGISTATSPPNAATSPQSTLERRAQLMRESMQSALQQMNPPDRAPLFTQSTASKHGISFDSRLPGPPPSQRPRTQSAAQYLSQFNTIVPQNTIVDPNSTNALMQRANQLGISSLQNANSNANTSQTIGNVIAASTNTNSNSQSNDNTNTNTNTTASATAPPTNTAAQSAQQDTTLNLTTTDLTGNGNNKTGIRFADGQVSFIENQMLADAMRLSMIADPTQQQDIINKISLDKATESKTPESIIGHLQLSDQQNVKRIARDNHCSLQQALNFWGNELKENARILLNNGDNTINRNYDENGNLVTNPNGNKNISTRRKFIFSNDNNSNVNNDNGNQNTPQQQQRRKSKSKRKKSKSNQQELNSDGYPPHDSSMDDQPD
ncbi:MAG: hypothetical protein ACPG2Y_02070, partial [Acholeplasmataceae bacterium]